MRGFPVWLALALAACDGGTTRAEYEALERRPYSVVLFLVDTLRADHLGCYGYGRDTSPRLDAFALDGVRFARCLSQSTWTKPATASIHTGLYPSRHGANQPFSVLDRSLNTLAETLAGAGYRTAGFGYNPYIFGTTDEATGFEQGFQTFEPIADAKRGIPRAERIVDAAIEWLAESGEEPFFLYLHLFDPHLPYRPPEPYAARFERGYSGAVDGEYALGGDHLAEDLDATDWRHLEDLYDAEVAYADAQFGRLLDALEEEGVAQDALVFFVSDHGEEFDEHGGWSHRPTLFQEIVHVPLVCRFPNLSAARRGSVVEDLALQIDLLPTVLDTLGLPADESLLGRSLLAKTLGAIPATRHGISEVDEFYAYRKAVVMDGQKYIRSWSPEPGEALFDLGRDPREQDDLSGSALLAPFREVLDGHLLASSGRYSVLFQNNTDALVRVTGFLATTAAQASGSELLGFEQRESGAADWDGPFELEQHDLDGERVFASRFTLRTAPGDRDGLVFVPSEFERRVRIVFAVDGRPPALEYIHLGESRVSPLTSPLVLDLSDPAAYLAPGAPTADPDDDAPYRFWIWKNIDVASPQAELSPAAIQALQAIGYLGHR